MTHLEEVLEEAKRVDPLREIELFAERNATTTTEPAGLRCADLYIRATPPSIGVGETAVIQVQAVLLNGDIIDVSRDSLLVLAGDIGSLDGTTVTGRKVGSGSVQATYNCAGEFIARQGAITVHSLVQVDGLIIRPSAIQIDTLQELLLKTDILYSDGQTKEVTANASFTNLTPQLGFVVGNRFIAGQSEGIASIEAQYTEDGKIFSATTMITIEKLLP